MAIELPGKAYDEKTFRHFLSIERHRAARANRSFLLLKISSRGFEGNSSELTSAAAARLWPLLWACVREVDFVGWYRSGRIAAAVLSQGVESSPGAAAIFIRQRVAEALERHLPPTHAAGLDVRVLHVRPTFRS